MTSRQTDLGEFADELADVQADSQLKWAAVVDAEVMRRETAFKDVVYRDDNRHDEGVLLTFELASGQEFEQWYAKPPQWYESISDLVTLLKYWGVSPGDLDKLANDDDVYEVPVEFDHGEHHWQPDWQEIEKSLHTRQLEAQDDA